MTTVVKGVLTVVKAAGPGWLIIAETVDDGLYRSVREVVGNEPATEEIMHFLRTLPKRLAAIEGAAVTLKSPGEGTISPKRAAREAARSLAEAHDPGRFKPTKAMQFEKAEFEAAKAMNIAMREIEVAVWVRYGKKQTAVLTDLRDGATVVEIEGHPTNGEANRIAGAALAHHYGIRPHCVTLQHGYATLHKSFSLRVPVA